MTTFINGYPYVRRVIVPRIDNNSIPIIETSGIIEGTDENAEVTFGINPCVWRALPNVSVVVWKVKHPVSPVGAELPVSIVIPSSNRGTTVASENSMLGTTKIPVIDNKSTQVLGHDVNVPSGTAAPSGQIQAGYSTEHWAFINKCCGIFRLMGVTAINSPAEAPAPAENVQAASKIK